MFEEFLQQLPADEPLLWMGLGSNVLIRDKGFNGTVVMMLGALQELEQCGENTIRAEAGVTCAKLSKFCARHGYEQGVFFSGIPGTVGGALAMNAGAFGGETWQTVSSVETIDHHGEIHHRQPSDFSVAYREVKSNNNEWFVAGHFSFNNGDSGIAKEGIKKLLRKRSASQPIGVFSCGSVFRNPNGDYAARLIESCGLKGKALGGAHVSEKHANFIINEGSACASDIEQLIEEVQTIVSEKCGVTLVRECHIIGDK